MNIKNGYILLIIFCFIIVYSFTMTAYGFYFDFIPFWILKVLSGILYLSFLFFLYKFIKETPQKESEPDSKQNIFIYFVPPVVFSIYPLIHIYLLNTGEVTFWMFAQAGLSVLVLCTALCGLFYIVYKDIARCCIMAAVTVFVLYQYLIFKTYLDSAVFWCFLLFAGVVISKIRIKNLFKIFVFISMVLFLFNAFEVTVFVKDSLQNIFYVKTKEAKPLPLKTAKSEKQPDVYIILLDAYPSNDVLKRDFNFDNSAFINTLEKKGFFIFDSIYSNYTKTICSLPSFLNHKYTENFEYTPSLALSNAALFKTAYDNGYKVDFINSFSGFKLEKGYVSSVTDVSKHYAGTATTINQAFFYGTFFQKMFPFFNKRNNVKDIFWTELSKEINVSSPKFVFAHIMAPHLPYLKDRNGKKLNAFKRDDILVNEITKEYKINKKNCIEYLLYTNNKTKSAVDEIFEKTGGNAYIIILGDHGLRLHYYTKNEDKNLSILLKEKNTMNAFFNTFLAFYSPYKDYEKYKDSTTIMNFFINFSNNVFNTKYKKQPDKFYFVYFNQNNDRLKDIQKNTKLLEKSQIEY